MEIAVVGTGYVGLVTGVCMAEKGHNVICIDVNEEKIELMNNGVCPIFENDLEDLMLKNKDRLTYTSDYINAYKDSDIIFIAVGTPEKKDGSANLSYVFDVAKNIAKYAVKDCVVVVKSTVPIGTNDKIEKLLNENKANEVCFHVVSNPEFLAQGTAVRDTLFASRIVIGAESEQAKEAMLNAYKNFDSPILIMNRRSAEMVKYASNDFLALKISYMNEIANLCEQIGADIERVAEGMGYDERIGNKFLNAGIGYGGSCFPKDTKALHWLANMSDCEIKTIKAAIDVNEQQKFRLIKKSRAFYNSFEGLTVAVLGLTFKPGTDDLREAPSLVNIPIFLEDGAIVKVWDPVGMDSVRKIFSDDVKYCSSIDEAIIEADICFIFTEWEKIKKYPIENYKKLMKCPIVLDGRNCYSLSDAKDIQYVSIGR